MALFDKFKGKKKGDNGEDINVTEISDEVLENEEEDGADNEEEAFEIELSDENPELEDEDLTDDEDGKPAKKGFFEKIYTLVD